MPSISIRAGGIFWISEILPMIDRGVWHVLSGAQETNKILCRHAYSKSEGAQSSIELAARRLQHP